MGQKRKREEGEGVAAGAAAARAFLTEFAALPLDSLPPTEAASKAQALFEGLQKSAAASPYLSSLLAEA